jgi:hypothetical protein
MLLPRNIPSGLLVFVSTTSVAFAYLDPGTGSILLQGLIAAVAAGLVTGKFWWHRVKSFFTKEETVEESPDDNE